MKTLKMAAVAALLALVATEMSADGVYRATKPYWWSQPAMKCDPPNEHGDYWCSAGAWQIRKLNSQGEDSLAAWGAAGYDPKNKRVSISIQTNFRHRNVTFTCSGDSEPLQVQRERVKSQEAAIIFEYWIWAPRARIEGCLLKPIKMTVDGGTFRLDTKLLRQAVANAVDQAAQ